MRQQQLAKAMFKSIETLNVCNSKETEKEIEKNTFYPENLFYSNIEIIMSIGLTICLDVPDCQTEYVECVCVCVCAVCTQIFSLKQIVLNLIT